MPERINSYSKILFGFRVNHNDLTYIIGVTISFDPEENIFHFVERKVSKYKYLGIVISLIVEALCSWHPGNKRIKIICKFNNSKWK